MTDQHGDHSESPPADSPSDGAVTEPIGGLRFRHDEPRQSGPRTAPPAWTPPSAAAPTQPLPRASGPHPSGPQLSGPQLSGPQLSGRQGGFPPGPPRGPYPGPQQGSAPGPWNAPPPGFPGGPPQTLVLGRPERSSRHGRLGGWVWPTVAALAMVVGLLGGAVGGAAYDRWVDSTSSPGANREGLDGVDTRDEAPLPPENGSVAAVAQELLPSTVQIAAEFDGQEGGATGSGFVIDRQGHVITNNHVVADAAQNDGLIEIVDTDGNRYTAELVGRSPVYDLAVLFVEDAPNLRPAALGASRDLRIGEAVVAIGSPLGLSSTVTAGIVSALNRPVTTGDSADDTSYIDAVQTDAAINPGNSGGPLVNLRGEVVGVNSAIATTGGGLGGESGNIGVGFAIPIEQVRVTADQILKTGEARYPIIGATVQTGGRDSGEGAVVEEVQSDTPAERAGLETDDVITAVDGDRVANGIALIVMIRTHQPGETIELTVRRGGEDRQVEVTLDSKVG